MERREGRGRVEAKSRPVSCLLPPMVPLCQPTKLCHNRLWRFKPPKNINMEILYFHFNFLKFSVCHEIMFSMINPSICKSRSIPSFSVDHLQPKMWRKLCQRTYKIRRHSDNTDENSKYTYHLKWTGDMNPYFESGKMGV